MALIRCIVHLSFAINEMSNSCISKRALAHSLTHRALLAFWAICFYFFRFQRMKSRFYAYMNMELLVRHLFVHISIQCIVSSHTRFHTSFPLCPTRVQCACTWRFFLLVVILLDFFIVLALVHSYTPLSSCDTFMQSKFTSHLNLCLCVSASTCSDMCSGDELHCKTCSLSLTIKAENDSILMTLCRSLPFTFCLCFFRLA